MPPTHPLEYIAYNPLLLITYDPYRHLIIDSGPMRPSLYYTDVYVEDLCKLAQG